MCCHQKFSRVRDYIRHAPNHQTVTSVTKVTFITQMCEDLRKRADEQRLEEQKLVNSRCASSKGKKRALEADAPRSNQHLSSQYSVPPEWGKSGEVCSRRAAQFPNLRGARQPEEQEALGCKSPYPTANPSHLGDHEVPQNMSARQTGLVPRGKGSSGYRIAPPPMVQPARSGRSQYYESGNQITSREQPFQILHATSYQPYSLPPQPGYAGGTGLPGIVTPNTGAANIAQNLRMLPAPKSDVAGQSNLCLKRGKRTLVFF